MGARRSLGAIAPGMGSPLPSQIGSFTSDWAIWAMPKDACTTLQWSIRPWYRPGFLVDSHDGGGPWAEASAAELAAGALDVGRPSIAQLDRHFRERQVLEVPAPAGVDLRPRRDAAHGDSRRPAILRRPRRGNLIGRGQRHAKGFAAHGKRRNRCR